MPADLAHFKRLTMGKPIIMGRRTWESLPGLLPYRTHIVVTRDRDYVAEGGFVVHSIEEAFRFAGDAEEMMVIGGADLYAQTLPLASRMYLTLIHEQIDGDTGFRTTRRCIGAKSRANRTRATTEIRTPTASSNWSAVRPNPSAW